MKKIIAFALCFILLFGSMASAAHYNAADLTGVWSLNAMHDPDNMEAANAMTFLIQLLKAFQLDFAFEFKNGQVWFETSDPNTKELQELFSLDYRVENDKLVFDLMSAPALGLLLAIIAIDSETSVAEVGAELSFEMKIDGNTLTLYGSEGGYTNFRRK